MSYTIKLNDLTKDVLRRSTITATTLDLPEQLTPEQYKEVKKVIVALGGKWNKKTHVFGDDPRPHLKLAVEVGSTCDERKVKQQFFTPPEIAKWLVQLAEIRIGHLVLEPSAGAGAIALVAAEIVGKRNVRCIELDRRLLDSLIDAGFASATFGDFLSSPPSPLFDRVVMNPPFAKGADIKHVLHAVKFLKPGGILAAICANGPRQKESLEGIAEQWIDLPPDAFKESGTSVSTAIVKILAEGVQS